jgi:outer membrane protein insertion porin family
VVARIPSVPVHAVARVVAALVLGVALGASAAEPPPDRALVLETIELEGATRTSLEVVQLWLPIAPGDAITPDELLDAIAALRSADLFAEVDFRTARGSARGQVKLVLEVREHGPDFRLGTGYRDLDGWYLIPAQLRWDNLRGRGDRLRLQLGIGYRLIETRFVFEEPRVGAGGRWRWAVELAGAGVDRRYFVDGVEYHHGLAVATIEASLGRRLGTHWSIDVGGAVQAVDADSTPSAAETDESRGIEDGDIIPTDQLPPPIRDNVGRKDGNIVRLDIARDGRSPRLVSFTPRSGMWGRVRTEAILREGAHAARVEADLRAYRALAGGVIAARARGGAVEETAAFYDRFYLGGLYTVRGFPDQSLSPPEGSTRYWSASAEFRARLAGPHDRPRLMGLVFVDAGQGWQRGETVRAADASVAVGYGLRLRIPWIDSLGLDLGIPLTESPTRTAWAGHVTLGWNY